MDTTDASRLLAAEELAAKLDMPVSTVHYYARKGIWPNGSVLEWGSTRRFRLDIIMQHGVVDMDARTGRQRRSPNAPTRPRRRKDRVADAEQALADIDKL